MADAPKPNPAGPFWDDLPFRVLLLVGLCTMILFGEKAWVAIATPLQLGLGWRDLPGGIGFVLLIAALVRGAQIARQVRAVASAPRDPPLTP